MPVAKSAFSATASPGTVLSIEGGPEGIVVSNRAEITVTLGGQVVGPQVSGIWKQGKDLLLPAKSHYARSLFR